MFDIVSVHLLIAPILFDQGILISLCNFLALQDIL